MYKFYKTINHGAITNMQLTETQIDKVGLMFDLDGTLCNSKFKSNLYLLELFQLFNLPPVSPKEIDSLWGEEISKTITTLYPEIEPDKLQELLAKAPEVEKKVISETMVAGSGYVPNLFVGVKSVLEEFNQYGFKQSVITNASLSMTRAILNEYDVSKYMITMNTADYFPGKPSPDMINDARKQMGTEPQHTFMIGDTTNDINAADNAGVKAIGVSWGGASGDSMKQTNAVVVVDTMYELRDFIFEYTAQLSK